MSCLTFYRSSIVLLALAPAVTASDLLPPERPIHEVVDHYINATLTEAGVTPADQADEANLVRRLCLDLAGRTATASEVQAYLASASSQKRVELVDRLLASPSFVRHHANELNTMVMQGTDGNITDYLRAAVAENRSWDKIVADMLSSDDDASDGANQFLKKRVKDLDRLTNDTSVLLFGVNVSCAQCHDHPLVPNWTQNHFFGMKSFFNRTFDNGGFLGERDYGLVSFKTTSGEDKQAELMFLTGTVVEEPEEKKLTDEEKKAEKAALDKAKKDKQPPPPPEFSRRAKLLEVALRPDERSYFSRSIVNRTWYRLFGHGLVAPLDQMHPENPPSHPELMEWLARDLVEHDYDLTRLVRGLVLSEAYSRSSRWEGEARPSDDLFAVARLRPLTPWQYATSLRLATTSPDRFSADLATDEFDKRIEGIENAARGFTSLIEQPTEGYQISVVEALLFTNSERVQDEFLRDAGDTLVGKLKTIDDPRERVRIAFWNVLSREPDDEEVDLLTKFVASRDDAVQASQLLVWTLLTTGESRFNY